MRVFSIYRFNIADKVRFKDAQSYIQNMLAELGFSWSDLAFAADTVIGDRTLSNVLEKFPELKKYYRSTDDGPMISSYTENWASGEIFADKSDYDDIFAVFSKIPRPFNIPFGHVLLSGVNWLGDGTSEPVPDFFWENADISRLTNVHFFSNYIAQERCYDDGLKRVMISVCIEVTADPEPRDPSTVIEKLTPYLGNPVEADTKCVFSREENNRFTELKMRHYEHLDEFMKKELPVPKRYTYNSNKEPILHLADIPVMKKAFAGTGFTRKKGNPGWLGEYDCRDNHGFTYRAYIQKISDGYTFRVWLNISGCNFDINTLGELNYEMEAEGESQPILREFALLCAKIRDEYGDRLARDFGETPDWYYKLQQA